MATKQEIAADAMITMAAVGNVGYSQGSARTGLRDVTPAQLRAGYVADTDCSFSVAWALYIAGFIPKSVLYGTIYTGNQAAIYAQYGATNLSFDSVGLGGLRVGDVLLSNGHTAMVVPYGGGLGIAEASLNEFGDILGGALGDQTGGETSVGPLRRGKWHTVQRWPTSQSTASVAGSTEEEELMAVKAEILKAVNYVNDRVSQIRSDIGTVQQMIKTNRNAINYVNDRVSQLRSDMASTQKMIKTNRNKIEYLEQQVVNLNNGLAYQNKTYLDPTKQAVARIDKKVK